MFIDITLKITPEMVREAQKNENPSLAGHLGTHFDVMDKVFPLEYSERAGIVFDVSGVEGRDIGISDVDLDRVKKDMFVAFYTGYAERVPYGEKGYFSGHPQLSEELIDGLLEKEISVIGLDFGGVRRGAEHTPKDQYCADRGVFIIENLCCLEALLEKGSFWAHVYPLSLEGFTGIPCRVIAQI